MEDFKFVCEDCGKEFEPDPDCMIESGVSRRFLPTEDAEELIEAGLAFTMDDLATMTEYSLKEIGLTPEDRDKMLEGESDIVTGGACICKECQDSYQEI